MDPQSARDKAQKMREEAARLQKEADEIDSDADERDNRRRAAEVAIDNTYDEQRQAGADGDSDKVRELGHKLRELEAEKRDAETGGSSIL